MKLELTVITCLQHSPNPYTTHNAVCGCLKHVVLQVISPKIAQNQEQLTFVLYTRVMHQKNVLSVPINVQNRQMCLLMCGCVVHVTQLLCVCVCGWVGVCTITKSMHVCLFTALRECFWACCNAHRCIFTHCLCIKDSVCVHLLECEQVYF